MAFSQLKSGASASSSSTKSKSKSKAQPTITRSLSKGHKYDRKSKKWQQLTDSITFCLAKDMMPIYSVEKTGFRLLLERFDPQYELPSRKYFSGTAIPALYARVREEVAKQVQSVELFAGTTDMWLASGTLQPYLSYTVHFVDQDWTLRNRCLQTLYLPDDHTGENIAEALASMLEAWGLDCKRLSCLTTDNGSNICAATRQLEWAHLSCFGHNLNLAVVSSLKDETRVSRAFGVCRKLVSTFSQRNAGSWEVSRSWAYLLTPSSQTVRHDGGRSKRW